MNKKKINFENARFIQSASTYNSLPEESLPEVVMVGKSNVGKSSFINSITNKKNMARTSSSPGKTREINFYNIDNKFALVDLPGYGYSKMSKTEEEKVAGYINEYLDKRKNIYLVILILDIRHIPTKNDLIMYEYILRKNIPFMVICNKADKIAITKVDNEIEKIKKELGISYSVILPYSIESKRKEIYIEKIYDNIIDKVIEEEE